MKREVADSDGQLAARLSVPAEQQGHLELMDLNNALARLPADQRDALILVGAEGFSYEDAATISGCAVGTVKSRVNRARAKVSELLAAPPPAGDATATDGKARAQPPTRSRVTSSS